MFNVHKVKQNCSSQVGLLIGIHLKFHVKQGSLYNMQQYYVDLSMNNIVCLKQIIALRFQIVIVNLC